MSGQPQGDGRTRLDLHRQFERTARCGSRSFLHLSQGRAARFKLDADMAATIDEARITTDATKRKALYAQIFQKGHDLHYSVPLFNLQDITACPKAWNGSRAPTPR